MLSPLIIHFVDGDVHNKNPSNIKLYCYNCYFINSDKKHRVHNPEIGDTFEEQEQITEDQITGDELAKELGESLSELFGKNGKISNSFKTLGSIPAEERKKFATDLNFIKDEIQEKIMKN